MIERDHLRVRAGRAARYRAEGLWDTRGLADGIEAAAERRPAALALADNDRRLTYAELARAIALGVGQLAQRGVRAGAGAVLVAGNSADAVIAYHALLRIGATVAVLDRRSGAADLRHALAALERGALVVVPSAERERLLGGLDLVALPLESFGPGRGSPAPLVTWPEPDRDEPAVVLFTSGTTSRPKAVVHSLDTLTAGAANFARIAGANEETVAFLVSPATSIAGIMQMHLTADCHGTLVLEDRFEPDASLDRIDAVGATLLGGAPVIAERLLRAASARRNDRIALRTLALGGAMLPRPLLELAADRFGIDVARVYGSSEVPNFSGSVPGDAREQRLSDDGVLMPGSEVQVGSADHPHEGRVRGPSLCLGYLEAEDHAAAFDADGWFRTGDLFERNGDRLTVTGRLREIANRSGLKISLSEIDAALAGLPRALEHACFAVPDPDTGERLAVAVQTERGAAVTLADVVAHLLARGTARRNLPEQLVLWNGPLPRTASGKIVRARLAMESPANPCELAVRLRPNG